MGSKRNIKGDLALLVIVLILGAGFFVYNQRTAPDGAYAHRQVIIEVDGKIIHKFNLAQDLEPFRIETKYGFNTVEIKGGKVRVAEADCPDLICVNTGWRGQLGQLIVCMPHRFLVKIEGEEGGSGKVDSFAY